MENLLQAEQTKKDPGASTFAKYWYQYNWALVKFLEECDSRDNCSLSIECNEDVMIIDDCTSNKTKVDLYQVKEKSSSKNISAATLAYGNSTKSIISKLVDNLDRELLRERINRLAIVSSVPIKMTLKDNRDSTVLNSFKWSDISDSDSKILMQSLQKDLKKEEIPLFIEFIKGIEGVNESTHSSIALKKLVDYIDKIEPNMACQPRVIFEVLRSELVRIGTDENIYTVWDDFIKSKVITSKNLKDIIINRLVPVLGSNFESVWSNIKTSEYFNDLNFMDRIKFKDSCSKYYNLKITSTDYMVFNDVEAVVSRVCERTDIETYCDFVTILVKNLNSNGLILDYFRNMDISLYSIANVEISEKL